MRRTPLVLMLFGGLAVAGAPARPATATERIVTDCGDTVPGGAAGQLRRLINDALAGDVILIPACTITLQPGADEDLNQTGDLDLDTDLTIQGAGPTHTILDGGGTDRVLDVRPGRTVGLSGLTIRNGSASNGGGINSQGTLHLTNVEVSGNQATSQGGGLYLAGPAATLSQVTVADNVAGDEGGGLIVFVAAGASLVNVTISGNRSAGDGGGLYLKPGATSLNNVTITANQANSDGLSPGNNGGGLAVESGIIGLRNTLVGGNTVGSGGSDPDCVVYGGPLQLLGANLIEQLSAGCTLTGVTTIIAGSAPGLGPLQDNGGPTRTHALLPGSPALEQGDGACAPFDQRGVRRPQGPRCDIGAYERLRVTPGRLEGGRLR